MNVSKNTRQLVALAMLVAISIMLVAFIHFPIIPAAPFLEYDPADIPIFIGTFIFGPACGIIITLVVCILQGITVSAQSGPYGIIMHFIATGSFVLVAGTFYRYNRTKKGAVKALIAGTLVWTVSMIIGNLIITPLFMGMPREFVLGMIIPAILPFNLIKAGVNSIITYLVYKPLKVHVFKSFEVASPKVSNPPN